MLVQKREGGETNGGKLLLWKLRRSIPICPEKMPVLTVKTVIAGEEYQKLENCIMPKH